MVYKGASQGEPNDPGQSLLMPLQIGVFRLSVNVCDEQAGRVSCKWLATLAGRRDPPWRPILKSSLTERGRVSAPGSSGNEMTGRVRRQGLGPRSAGRTRNSSNCGVWVRERHRVNSVAEICRAAVLTLVSFLNKCIQICVSSFSWHL